MQSKIVVRGAREHNLRGIDVEIPRDQLVVITGLSGSGKSSLAFDTIYAEGQRRYVESLSAYARQFLDQKQKPDVDSIEGLSPAISIEQKSTSKNPRSTVGTLTEIYDYLRVLFARIGLPHCYSCGKPIAAQSVQQIVDSILSLPERSRFMLLAPVVSGRKGEYKKELQQFQRAGFVRVRIDGILHALSDDISMDKRRKHDIDLVVDRLVLRPDMKQRLTDSVELALKHGGGALKVQVVDGAEQIYSQRFACDACGVSYPEVAPRLFSFNSPHGACPTCDGLGYSLALDPAKLVPDGSKSLEEGAIVPWSGRWSGYYVQQLKAVTKHYGASMRTPWAKLGAKMQQIILEGSAEDITFAFSHDGHAFRFERPFEGVIPALTRRLREKQTDRVQEEMAPLMVHSACGTCNGARLKPEALAVKIGGKSIADIGALPVGEADAFFAGLSLTDKEAQIARRVLKEVRERLAFLLAVGLDYLSLARSSATLSGGEAQRIRLATQIGSALQGVIYVLDEPSIGLHQRDNERLLTTLRHLCTVGNTVLVVEHDEDTIRAADWVLDMGPGAGSEGGLVVSAGTPAAIMADPKSLTGDYLAGRRVVRVPTQRRRGRGQEIVVHAAEGNNLKRVTARFGLGQFIAVTGVSGSGKSTLVNDTLHLGLARALNGASAEPAAHARIEGTEHIDKVIDIDQSAIGRTPRSNPATYTQLFGLLRELFAGLPDSRARVYKPGRYSFNVRGGRCEACEGDGILRIEMHFLPDVFVTCETCQGKRYNRETLEIRFKGKNIAEVLGMTVDDASAFLDAIPKIKRKLSTLQAVGLGYLQLGQSATTLSGGEAQRIKLARELSKRPTGRTLYILDEPTTGLHFHDVARLLDVLHALVDGGNTVVVIEHNLDVIKTADHVIDMGPEGGHRGGILIAEGTPEQIAAHVGSHTGRFLAPLLPRAS